MTAAMFAFTVGSAGVPPIRIVSGDVVVTDSTPTPGATPSSIDLILPWLSTRISGFK